MSVIFLMKTHCVCYHKMQKNMTPHDKTTYVLIVALRPDEAPLGVAEVEAAGHPRDLPLAVHEDARQVVTGLRLGLGVVMLTLRLKYS